MIIIFGKNSNNVWTVDHSATIDTVDEIINGLNSMLILLSAYWNTTDSINQDSKMVENVIHNMQNGDKRFMHDPIAGTYYFKIIIPDE